MISFKQYLDESKYATPTPLRQVTMAELKTLLSKGQMTSLSKNSAVKAVAGMDQAYKYGVTQAGFTQVEIYAYYASTDVLPDGRVRPTRLLQVNLDPRKVVGVHRFYRRPDSDSWIPLS